MRYQEAYLEVVGMSTTFSISSEETRRNEIIWFGRIVHSAAWYSR